MRLYELYNLRGEPIGTMWEASAAQAIERGWDFGLYAESAIDTGVRQ